MPEDWKKIAREAWDAPSWKTEAIKYRADHPTQPVPPREQTKRVRRLMDPNISLERVWHELNSTSGRAADMTVEALMFSLRERGTKALSEPDTQRRLSQCSDAQVIEIGDRLQRLKPHIGRGPWSADQVRELIRARQC
jgi:hypothetical protein